MSIRVTRRLTYKVVESSKQTDELQREENKTSKASKKEKKLSKQGKDALKKDQEALKRDQELLRSFVAPTRQDPEPSKELPVSRIDGLDKEVLKVFGVQLPSLLSHVCYMFNEMEKVVMIYFSLGKRITLDLIKKNIAKNCQKAFTDAVLGKILAIYPESYQIELEKSRFNKPGQPVKYETLLKPNIKDDLHPYYHEEYVPKSPSKQLYSTPIKLVSPRKKPQNLDYIPSPPRSPRKGQAVPLPREIELHLGPKFEGWRKHCRSAIMKYKLHQYLLKEHEKFLESHPLEGLKEGVFHPDFVVNRIDITPIELPKPKQPAKQMTMMDYLNKVPTTGILKSVEKVTEELRSPEKKVKLEKNVDPVPKSGAKMSLLERIRQKAKEAEEREKRKDPELIERVSVLETLQKTALAVICSEYNNRTSMDINELYKKLNFSIQTRKDAFERMVGVLSEIASSHIDVIHLNQKKFVKMVNNDRAKLTEIINEELERCKKLMR
ncbi:unnamed protein product [Bursaphelenchus xylophilus]|uniref:(pine wood nematode) hypothetical protein n=1 Tax=Bursaphelenchus xylophilus TaxID=6326 RepID=A0A1I7RLD1_BURXY|nr:unnamed protein product [Bursaphelenchus xylophilus]CAG9083134.1 unnamed protein product [Bursaphelenchus xylophilus]